jgi:hypothetical protein
VDTIGRIWEGDPILAEEEFRLRVRSTIAQGRDTCPYVRTALSLSILLKTGDHREQEREKCLIKEIPTSMSRFQSD